MNSKPKPEHHQNKDREKWMRNTHIPFGGKMILDQLEKMQWTSTPKTLTICGCYIQRGFVVTVIVANGSFNGIRWCTLIGPTSCITWCGWRCRCTIDHLNTTDFVIVIVQIIFIIGVDGLKATLFTTANIVHITIDFGSPLLEEMIQVFRLVFRHTEPIFAFISILT